MIAMWGRIVMTGEIGSLYISQKMEGELQKIEMMIYGVEYSKEKSSCRQWILIVWAGIFVLFCFVCVFGLCHDEIKLYKNNQIYNEINTIGVVIV